MPRGILPRTNRSAPTTPVAADVSPLHLRERRVRADSRRLNEARNEAEALHRERYFWPLFLFLWTALNALFLSADIFNLYVTLELLGFAAVALVALAGKRAALTAALRYLFVSLTASLFYLLGVGLVYGQCATVDLPRCSRPKPSPGRRSGWRWR